MQASRPKVYCEGTELFNVFLFKYLGTLFSADGDQTIDIKARIATAMSRCGKLRHILDNDNIPLQLKLRLYAVSVCSVLKYGCETWTLDTKACKMINGANSKMLARFTGKTIPQEARPQTTSYNLLLRIRQQRLRWVGHILRCDEERIIHTIVQVQHEHKRYGNLLMDAPPHQDLHHLTELAMDRATWRDLVAHLPAAIPPPAQHKHHYNTRIKRNKGNNDNTRSNETSHSSNS